MTKLYINTIEVGDDGITYQYVTSAPALVYFGYYPDEDSDMEEVHCNAANYMEKREETETKYDLALGSVEVQIPDRNNRLKIVPFGGDNSSPSSIDISCEKAEKGAIFGQMRFWRQGSEPGDWR